MKMAFLVCGIGKMPLRAFTSGKRAMEFARYAAVIHGNATLWLGEQCLAAFLWNGDVL
jgi:hypothetical protein